jgi:hypothetical protein
MPVRVSNHPVYAWIPGHMRESIEAARAHGQTTTVHTPHGSYVSSAGGPWIGPLQEPFSVAKVQSPKQNRRKGGKSFRERQAAGRAARRAAR